MLLPLLAAAALAAPLVTAPKTPVPTAIAHVRVFESERGVVDGPWTVLLQDGRIVAVVPDAEAGSVTATVTVDGTGKTLVPGLVDLHTHVSSGFLLPDRLRLPDVDHNLAAYVWAGVTTVLDLSTPIDTIERLRHKIDHGLPGPRIYGSGRPFTAPLGHPIDTLRALFPGPLVRMATRHAAWGVVTPDDVDRAIGAEGPRDVVKVMLDEIPEGSPVIGDDALARLRVAATALGRPLVAHVGRTEDFDRAVSLPVDVLAHAPYGGAVSDESIAKAADRQIPVIATLSVWQAVEELARGKVVEHPLERDVLDARGLADLDRGLSGATIAVPSSVQAWATALVDHHDDRVENVRRMHAAGVPLLVGSDAPNMNLAAGAATHEELALLREAGLSPAEALSDVTWYDSRFFGPDTRFGAIQPGFEADLLLVDGDPVADPDALDRIVDVWVDGRRLVRR